METFVVLICNLRKVKKKAEKTDAWTGSSLSTFSTEKTLSCFATIFSEQLSSDGWDARQIDRYGVLVSSAPQLFIQPNAVCFTKWHTPIHSIAHCMSAHINYCFSSQNSRLCFSIWNTSCKPEYSTFTDWKRLYYIDS